MIAIRGRSTRFLAGLCAGLIVALLLLLAFVLTGAAARVSAAPVQAGPTVARVQVVGVEVSRAPAPQVYGGSATKVDGVGHLFTAVLHYNGNDSDILVDEYNTAGAIIGAWSAIAPPDACGFDKQDATAGLSATGSDLIVNMTSHLQCGRDYLFSVARIAGVYVPYAGAAPEDGSGASVPGGAPSTGCPTAQEVAQATSALLQPYISTQINNAVATVVANMESKNRAAIDKAFEEGTGSYFVWRQLLDTSSQGADHAIRALTPTATVTAVPTRAPAKR